MKTWTTALMLMVCTSLHAANFNAATRGGATPSFHCATRGLRVARQWG